MNFFLPSNFPYSERWLYKTKVCLHIERENWESVKVSGWKRTTVKEYLGNVN